MEKSYKNTLQLTTKGLQIPNSRPSHATVNDARVSSHWYNPIF
jgi:hypothetical protein